MLYSIYALCASVDIKYRFKQLVNVMNVNDLKQPYLRLKNMSNLALAVTLVGFVVSVLIAYPYAEYFQLSTQIASHIFTILLAAVFKVACIVRMIALQGINKIGVA